MLHISIPPIITQATQKPSAQKKNAFGKNSMDISCIKMYDYCRKFEKLDNT